MRRQWALIACALAVGACSTTDSTAPKSGSILMEVVAGQNDTADVGTVVPLSVKITDGNGVIQPGQLVNWVITQGTGKVFVSASIADQYGVAKNLLTLGSWENAVELRAIDGQGNAVTYATINGLGGHLVYWRPLYFGDATVVDGNGFIVHPNVPFNLTQHMSFQIVDGATGKDIPNFIIPPSAWYYWGNGTYGTCEGDITAILCSGVGYGAIINIFPQNSGEDGPSDGFLWEPGLLQNQEERDRNEQPASIEQGAAVAFTAAFTYTCTAKHVCFFDASSSNIPNGVGLSGYNWYFGDGYQGTRVTVQHTYPHAGTYSVTMSVYDTKGKNAKITTVITVP